MEWIQSDGKRELGNALETLPLTEAYARFLSEKHPPTKKRKLDSDHTAGPPSATCGPISKPQLFQHPELERQPAPEPTPAQGIPTNGDRQPSTHSIHNEDASTALSPSEKPSITPPLHFYLRRPHTPSSSRVVIPLPPSSTLAEILRNRVVLEFPTIYTLSQPPNRLPDGYMLESEFLGLSKKEDEEIEELLAVLPTGSLDRGDVVGWGSHTDTKVGQSDLDDRKILDVLRRDLGAA